MNDEDTDDKRRTITHYLMLMRKELIREIIVICDPETVKILLETVKYFFCLNNESVTIIMN